MRLFAAPPASWLALMLCSALAPAGAQGGNRPAFEDAPCPFRAAAAMLEQIRCGWVEVPENRAHPEGRRLRLAVAILKSMSPTPRPDPVVFLMGGPGQGFVQNAAVVAASPAWAFARADRDLILYDQRGTGYSDPTLCPRLDTVLAHPSLMGRSKGVLTAAYRAEFAACATELAAADVDLSQYHSVVSALDLRDLREALGLDAWNVWGVSYGGRLALEALRTAPEAIRSVILDSPSPPNAAHWADGATNITQTLTRTFARCAADAACAAAFPDAEAQFWETVEALEREPIVVRTRAANGSMDSLRVNGGLMASGVFRGLYRPEFHAVLPLLTREVSRRNRDLVGNMAQQLALAPGVMSLALHWAVECHEVAPVNSRAAEPAPRDDREALLERLELLPSDEACDALHPFRAGVERAAPVHSDRPVLIFTGALDPITPTHYARLAAASLPNAQLATLPGGGHWEAHRHECTRRLMREFLNDPSATLDLSCADSVQPPPFITDVRLTPGVSRIAMLLAPGASPLLLGGVLLPFPVLLSGLVVWPAARLWRRRRPTRVSASPFERTARLGAVGVALLTVAFVAALGWTVMQTLKQNPYLLALGLPTSAAPLLAVPWLLLAGSVGLLVAAGVAWRRDAWTRWERIHFTLVAVASAVIAAGCVMLGIV